ncbi:MAG: response regulator transcription factor [Dolichospermum sp.]|jgi:two-component system alkaline phosphatase synthesis response regulator PhoP|uniref:response regulator transcription factor n=1 Tax=Dolichospermum circinale TaxID=109265 RepID=UPI001989C343|nr:response regulator [Dolichospermum circinale]MBD1214439.1 response regulator [Dolichospermum circinale Clear-D4]MCE2720953.1 response regulator [Anabaena sp. 49628_E55]MDB9452886.1 response regulator [Dolichospermum circinale CS-541/06]MDB9461276.1 response regulator [Dolichospermum circinale CS-541/04]MDB9467581.1 response regulator [Dolichospermum circinale CS-539/09]
MSLILVIEDETQILSNLQEILELADFNVIAAVDGTTGLQLAKSKNPDLIICDIMMPGLNGYEVLQKLRQEPKCADIPLIFLTAKANRSDLRQGMCLGADDYITKPFEPLEILQAVKARLQKRSIPGQAYLKEARKSARLEKEIKTNQLELQNSNELAQVRESLLRKVSIDLSNPVSNINMAICMLKEAKTEKQRERYLSILQQECRREIEILNEIDSLRELLSAENTKLLRDYKLLDVN